MRRYMKNLTALLLAIIILLSAYLPTFAAGQPTKYSTSSNSGQRDVVCTTLSGTSASSYYTGSYSYDNLDDLSASELKSTLKTLMSSTHKKTSSYNDCRDMATSTDCENNNGKITMIYTSYQGTYSQYNGGNGWNREHVWPQSLGGGNTSGGGADLHHIRPSESKTNSTRGNKKYGNVNSGSTATGNLSGMSGGTYAGNYYEPLDNVKGDVARICLYVYVRWGSSWGADSITEVFQSVDVLLEWCEMDPVDTWEMGRNEVVAAYQGNRNVFIDYPELAWLIFGKSIPEDMTTPSGNAADGGGNNSGSCSHANTTVKNATTQNCGKNGYTGDTYCVTCNTKLQSGTTIFATGDHSFGEWVVSPDGRDQSRSCEVCGEKQNQQLEDGQPVGTPESPIIPSGIVSSSTDAEIILIYFTLGAGEELFVGALSE